jgi:flavin reductase (DIM6/NTAB) family NADH-FMN oxidoreductase RutF
MLKKQAGVNFHIYQVSRSETKKYFQGTAMVESVHAIAQILDQVDRAVWVVTASAEGKGRSGLLATWVMPSSLDRSMPMVSVSLGRQNLTAELVDASGAFVLHLLRPDQAALALDFGLRSGRDVDKFAGLQVTASATGAPILVDCLAALDCRLLKKIDIADRLCIWAEVVAGKAFHPGGPLFEHALLAAATPEQRAAMQSQLQRDAQRQRSAWRNLRR